MSEQMSWKVDAVIYLEKKNKTKKTNEMKMQSTYVNNKRVWLPQLHVGTSHFSKPKRSNLCHTYHVNISTISYQINITCSWADIQVGVLNIYKKQKPMEIL